MALPARNLIKSDREIATGETSGRRHTTHNATDAVRDVRRGAPTCACIRKSSFRTMRSLTSGKLPDGYNPVANDYIGHC